MNIIATKGEELQVISLRPYAYTNGKNEKFLKIEVSADSTTFDELRALLEGNKEPIEYYEDDALMCEYNGYSAFDCTYHEGKFTVELHKGTIVSQMSALLNSNETLVTENATLKENNAFLIEQNDMLNFTLTDLLTVVIPDMIAGIMVGVEDLTARVETLEANDTGETVSE